MIQNAKAIYIIGKGVDTRDVIKKTVHLPFVLNTKKKERKSNKKDKKRNKRKVKHESY